MTVKTVQITLNQRELDALIKLIDDGVKATGLDGAGAAVLVMSKLQEAVEISNKLNAEVPETKLEVVE